MIPRLRLIAGSWLLVPLCALCFSIWLHGSRLQRANYVSQIEDWSVATPVEAPSSSTGYAGGTRRWLAPGGNHDSQQWISTTQQMVALGQWRVRHVFFDNAPAGRESHAPSPYRWWLALVAWGDHAISGRPLALSVERSAGFADPLLHLTLLIGTAALVARHFGLAASAAISLGLVALFPWTTKFFPGAPDHHSLAQALGVWSILLLLIGLDGRTGGTSKGERENGRWFFWSGVAGGCGVWINLASMVPLIAGAAVGMAFATLAHRRQATGQIAAISGHSWRIWGLGGGTTILAAYLIEYFPAHMGAQLVAVHPIYALLWISGAELLARISAQASGADKPARSNRNLAVKVAAGLVFLASLLAIGLDRKALVFVSDPLAERLTNLPLEDVTRNLAAWLAWEGPSLTAFAMLVPLLIIGPALWLLFREHGDVRMRIALAVALGPVVLTLLLACFRLHWWGALASALLPLLAISLEAASRASSRKIRWMCLAILPLLLPGLIQALPEIPPGQQDIFTETEVRGLVERDLAHWLAARTEPGQAVVLAPPALTASLVYHGGLRGLGTFHWENAAGLNAALRIANALDVDRTLELIQKAGITHIVLPSWETTLEDSARLVRESTPDQQAAARPLVEKLRQWALPAWLRPIPYRLAAIEGFEDQSVVVFAVDYQPDEAVALGRLIEYFIEMGQLEYAQAVGSLLSRYPRDLPALVARAEMERAGGNDATFLSAVETLAPYLVRGPAKGLPFDRRVSLAVVLSQGGRAELARAELRQCLTELDAKGLRSLSANSLLRFHILLKATGLEVPDPTLRKQMIDLAPPEMHRHLL